MNPGLNVVTVCAGPRYGIEYVTKMRSMVDRHLKIPFEFYCVTDRPDEMPEGIKAIVPPEISHSWWAKLFLYSDLMPDGDLLYLDLDQIILQDITEVIQECLRHPFSCFSDHMEWQGCKLGTALMTFKAGSLLPVFDLFWPNRDRLMDFPGGDQAWIAQTGLLPEVFYLDEKFPPGTIASYKFDIVPTGKPPGAEVKICNMHGKPKAHHISGVQWVKDNWR